MIYILFIFFMFLSFQLGKHKDDVRFFFKYLYFCIRYRKKIFSSYNYNNFFEYNFSDLDYKDLGGVINDE